MNEQKLTWYWFTIYLLSALLVLSGIILLGIHFGPQLESWLLQKLIPGDWHLVYRDLVDRLFREELRSFLVTSGFGIGIVTIGMTLFPLKEKLSSVYEEEHFPALKKYSQPPILRQGLEEVKLAGLYLLLQSFSLYLALQGHLTLAAIGKSLSIFYLVFAMALDHCAPFFQRRRLQIHEIIWLLLRHAPLPTLTIGALFICPSLILEKLLPSTLTPLLAIGLLVLTEVLGMALATLAGCHLGAELVSENPEIIKGHPPRSWSWSYRTSALTLFLWMAIFFGWWAKGTLRHSQFIRSQYSPVWSDLSFKIREGRSESEAKILVTLPIKVRNRSESPIDPTQLEVEVSGTETLNAKVSLTGPAIEGNSEQRLTLHFQIQIPVNELARGDVSQFAQSHYSAHLLLKPPLSHPVKIPLFTSNEDGSKSP